MKAWPWPSYVKKKWDRAGDLQWSVGLGSFFKAAYVKFRYTCILTLFSEHNQVSLSWTDDDTDGVDDVTSMHVHNLKAWSFG